MKFSEEIRRTCQKCFLTQSDFAKAVIVAFSTVNRWECGKAKPNLSAMKSIKAFCLANQIEFSPIEKAWLKVEYNDLLGLCKVESRSVITEEKGCSLTPGAYVGVALPMKCWKRILRFFDKIAGCIRTIEKARQARDRLLSKLMSGELEV